MGEGHLRVGESGCGESVEVLLPRQGAGDAADVAAACGPVGGGEVVLGDDVGDAEAPTRAQITAYPQFNCGNTTGCWTVFGGTSAATPQTAALTALVNAARASQDKQPIGYLAPLLYQGVGATSYTDIVPQHYGSAPKDFAGAEVGVSGPIAKSVGDL
jgi:hypothetical protein